MQSSSTKRLSIAIMLVMFFFIVIMEQATANPNPEQHEPVNSVVDALRYLQDIEKQHGQFARPR